MSSKKVLDESLTRDIESIMLSAAQIQERIQELGSQITHDYRELEGPELATNPPIAIGLLRGAITFMADLTRALSIPIEYDFMQLSSYGQSHEAGPLRLLHDLTQPVAGRHLLVIEDIVDTGQTLSYLCGWRDGVAAEERAASRHGAFSACRVAVHEMAAGQDVTFFFVLAHGAFGSISSV